MEHERHKSYAGAYPALILYKISAGFSRHDFKVKDGIPQKMLKKEAGNSPKQFTFIVFRKLWAH
jgi:hypothetical protein